MEEISQWDDKYIIDMRDRQQENEAKDDAEEEAIMLTNQECEYLKKFLVQEAAEQRRSQESSADNKYNKYHNFQ